MGSGFGRPNLITPVGSCLQLNLSMNQNRFCLDSGLEQIRTDLFTRSFLMGEKGGHQDPS